MQVDRRERLVGNEDRQPDEFDFMFAGLAEHFGVKSVEAFLSPFVVMLAEYLRKEEFKRREDVIAIGPWVNCVTHDMRTQKWSEHLANALFRNGYVGQSRGLWES